jgi:hypothetical protein
VKCASSCLCLLRNYGRCNYTYLLRSWWITQRFASKCICGFWLDNRTIFVPENIRVIRNKDVVCFLGRNNRLLTKYYQNGLAIRMVKHDRNGAKTDDIWLIWKRKLKSECMHFAYKHCKHGTLKLAYLKLVEIWTEHSVQVPCVSLVNPEFPISWRLSKQSLEGTALSLQMRQAQKILKTEHDKERTLIDNVCFYSCSLICGPFLAVPRLQLFELCPYYRQIPLLLQPRQLTRPAVYQTLSPFHASQERREQC